MWKLVGPSGLIYKTHKNKTCIWQAIQQGFVTDKETRIYIPAGCHIEKVKPVNKYMKRVYDTKWQIIHDNDVDETIIATVKDAWAADVLMKHLTGNDNATEGEWYKVIVP